MEVKYDAFGRYIHVLKTDERNDLYYYVCNIGDNCDCITKEVFDAIDLPIVVEEVG